MILDVTVFKPHRTDPTAAFLHRLTEKHDCSEAEFLADFSSYWTFIARLESDVRINYTNRNLIEKLFQTSK
ncbi:transposase [Haloferax elongans ATCC BAA-1513]|uniref:Transposase n=1 Tax=Haloferax elongans ATCC BAA-1513 TaxID=1230453 RepID=M0I2H8_HALEO|nr:transposase [Haloferax elongans ATCC BAA-1513]